MIGSQYVTFAAMSACGLTLGAVYDAYRILLREWRLIRFLGAVLDFCFWIFAAVLVLSALWWADDADVRVYTFVLLLLGYTIYRLTVARLVRGSTLAFARLVVLLFRVLWRTFHFFFVAPVLLLWRILSLVGRFVYGIMVRIEPLILWPILLVLRMLRWMTKPLWKLFAPLVHRLEGIWGRLSKGKTNDEDEE